MISRRTAIALMGLAIIAPATAAMAESATLKGSVFFRERMMLPPTAVVEVKLLDVSLADAPAKVLAETTIPGGPGTPTPFELTYDATLIDPKNRYALQARIVDGDQLLFINTTAHPVFAGGENATDILVQRVVETEPEAASPAGSWLAEDIRGNGVIDRLQSVLEIATDGSVSGTGGCNRLSGKALIEGDAISFGHLASTNMACAPGAMDQEQKFHEALGAARRFRVDSVERKLFLIDGDGAEVMRLSAM